AGGAVFFTEENSTPAVGVASPTPNDSAPEKPRMLNEAVRCSEITVRTGTAVTLSPGFCARVPRINREFFGLMQYSSTFSFWSLEMQCRARKVVMFGGILGPKNSNEVPNSS